MAFPEFLSMISEEARAEQSRESALPFEMLVHNSSQRTLPNE
jgi:hypothetical protein